MSLILAIPISVLILICGMSFNVSPDYLVLALAIIFAGGLAGFKD